MKRRKFIAQTTLAVGGMAFVKSARNETVVAGNPLPAWRGFNILDYTSPNPVRRTFTTEDHFKWMHDWGFDFVRVPMAYPCYLEFDRSRNIEPEEVYHLNQKKLDEIDETIALAHKYNMHVSINLHRAPGYCINAGFHEPYNLWKDEAAQKAFYFHWEMWAKRHKNDGAQKISFDLLNEPCMRDDMNDQLSPHTPVTGELYRKVAKAASEAIRSQNPNHLVIADGNDVGNAIIPEITDLNIAQSCRGYRPGAISHYKAPWANKDPEHMPEPKWPGQVGNQMLSREMLETYYKPWIELTQQGVGVHCGESGCWNKTPHEVFLAWFKDVTDILSANKIGFALWNFIGDFGIIDSGRADVAYEDWYGRKLDRALLNLIKKS